MEQISGQQRAIEVLQTAVANGRLHHAYIFHGPVGVGKFTTAYHFAKLLLCHDPVTDLAGQVGACGGCESCRLMSDEPTVEMGDDVTQLGAMHPDFHVVTKELARYHEEKKVREQKLKNIPNDVVKDSLVVPVSRAAQLKHGKVFVVDEAELLAVEGQNTLLKTLEEPPEGTYLILVTSHEDRLLATVRSRCQRVAFSPVGDEVVGEWLGERYGGLADDARDWIVEFAGGSIGLAKLAVDNELFGWAVEILPAIDEMSRGVYPAELGAQMAEFIDEFAKKWVDDHENASKDAANRHGARLLLSIVSGYARRKMMEAAGKCEADDPVSGEGMVGPWLGVIDAVTGAEAEYTAYVNMGLVTDHLVAKVYEALSGGSVDVGGGVGG